MKKFIEHKVGWGWFFLFVISGIYFWNILNLSWWGILAFPAYVFWGMISVIIADSCKPDAIITTGGYLSHINAELFYMIGLPLAIMFILPVLLLLIVGNLLSQPNIDNLRKSVETSCATEQIAKTGTKGCKDAKDALVKYINMELPKVKEQYKKAQNEVKRFSKDKDIKCSEKGLVEYGSEGCSIVTTELETETQYMNELDTKIKNLEKELNFLKK